MKPYKNLRFEIRIPREKHSSEPFLPGIKFPKKFSFEDSLNRLRKKGFSRHPSPSELLKLVKDGLEGKVGFLNRLALRSMLYPDSGMSHWVDMVFERAENEMIVRYGNIEGLVLGQSRYEKDGFRYDHEARFDFTNYILGNPEWCKGNISVRRKDLPPPLIELLYGKNFSELDNVSKQLLKKEHMSFPLEEGIYPLSLMASTRCVPMFYYPTHAASRGVK